MNVLPQLETGQIFLDPERNWYREIIQISAADGNHMNIWYTQTLRNGEQLKGCVCWEEGFRTWVRSKGYGNARKSTLRALQAEWIVKKTGEYFLALEKYYDASGDIRLFDGKWNVIENKKALTLCNVIAMEIENLKQELR